MTDRAAAIETVKALAQLLKDTRASMEGTSQALQVAVKALRDAHNPDHLETLYQGIPLQEETLKPSVSLLDFCSKINPTVETRGKYG